MRKTLQSDESRKWIEKFPNTGNSQLSRMMYKGNEEIFDNVEAARCSLRYVRNSAGAKNRKRTKDKTIIHFPNGYHSKWLLPEEDHNDYTPFVIKGAHLTGVLGDLHLPYQANAPIEITLNHYKARGIDILILNGDIMDCHKLSKFVIEPRKRDMIYEIGSTRDFLERLRELFPNVRIIYKEGNHEERLETYLKQKAPELFGFEEFQLKELLHLRDLDIEWVGNKRRIKLGKLWVLHGHEFGYSFFNAVNPARGMFLRAKDNILVHHYHQKSEHEEPNLGFEQLGAWSAPCLCDLHPEFLPINKWVNGAATVETDKSGMFSVENFKIIDNKIRT